MNAPLSWKAIGLGVAVGIGGALLMSIVWRVFPFDASERPLWMVYVLSYAAGVLIDAATGATAGWLARVRGAAHGFFAGLIAGVISPFIGFAFILVETRGAAPIEWGGYFTQVAIGAAIGIVVAAVAGAIAARLAAKDAG